jgi:hypothetical protein
MKRQILPVIFVTILAFFLGALPAICEEIDKNSQLKEYYENYINEKILKCHSKAQLRESRSAHLQNYAVREIKKAIFLSENKELLIKEMVKREIGVKQYKIEYFLNSQFYGNNETLQGKLF